MPAELTLAAQLFRCTLSVLTKLLWRATMLAGFALRKPNTRLANILAELLNENTTFEEMMMVMQAIFSEEMKGLVNRKPAATLIPDARFKRQVTGSSDNETRDNA